MHARFILCIYYLPSRCLWLWIFVVHAFAEVSAELFIFIVFVLQCSVLIFWHFKYPIRVSTGISFHFRCKILWFSLVDANCFGDWIFLFPTLKPSLCKQLRLRLATLLSIGVLSNLYAFHRSTENSLLPLPYSSLAVSIVCPGLSPGI